MSASAATPWDAVGLVAGVAALLAAVLAFVSRRRRGTRGARRTRLEDTLKYLYSAELDGTVPSLQSVAGAVDLSVDEAAEVLQGLERRQLIEAESGGIRLSARGRELGLNVLRAHRLWETYLADRTGFPETEWHGRAHDLEHGLSAAEVEALAARLQHPTHDPHGDPIPTAQGELAGPRGVPLTGAPAGGRLRVLHLEDEPAAVYAQLVAIGLYPGAVVRLLEVSPQRVRLLVGWSEHVLAPLVAASVSVEPLAQASEAEAPVGEPLSVLRVGESGRVLSLSPRCRGAERRRLMDLGVLPGTVIAAEMRSPGGDPTAYQIRGALIALRAVQAELIRVERLPDSGAAAA